MFKSAISKFAFEGSKEFAMKWFDLVPEELLKMPIKPIPIEKLDEPINEEVVVLPETEN